MASQPNLLIRWRYRIEYGLYLLGRTLYGSLPSGVLRRFGPLLGHAGFIVNRRHRKVALDNLGTAYPELDDAAHKQMGRACFESFGMLLTDFLCSTKLERDEYLQRFEVEGLQHLEAAEAVGKGVILLTGHLGNWEGLAQYLALSGRSVSFVARPLDNPYMEEDFRYLRERFGNHSIPKRKAARGSLKVLRGGGTVGILMDQRVHPREGKAYPFFGKPAYTTTMPARLSLKTGAPAVLIFGIPNDNWRRCRIVVHPPIVPDPGIESSEAAVDRLTARYLEIIEQTIRDQPHLWLWMHRKWRQYDRPIPIRRKVMASEEAPVKTIQSPGPTTEEALSRSSRRA